MQRIIGNWTFCLEGKRLTLRHVSGWSTSNDPIDMSIHGVPLASWSGHDNPEVYRTWRELLSQAAAN